jgi:hypothetical protein
MNLTLESINWLAVIVAALATFFLGGLWYTALFGKSWVRLHGYTEAQIAAMKQAKPPAVFFSVMIVSYLLVACIVAIIAGASGIESAVGGATLGLLLWFGFALAIGLTSYIASDKPFGVYAIDLSYQFVFLIMTGAIIGAWR